MRTGMRLYAIAGALLLGLYGWAETRGWETYKPVRGQIGPSVRQSPGGWRTWTFWHRGVRGGK